MSIFAIHAQKAGIVFSSDKTPQKDQVGKLRILKNGNTASIEFVEDLGIVCKLYDTNKKKVSEVTTILSDKINKSRLRCVYEINNEIMVMVHIYAKNIPKLYRYLYDGTSGKFISETLILERSAIAPMEKSDFRITKDPASDFYAVIIEDPSAKEINKVIEVIHYSPKHEIINKSYLNQPDSKFKLLNACDMYVNGGESIILTTYACNTTKKNGEDAAYYLSQLKKGTTVFTTTILAQTKSSELTEDNAICKFIYDAKNKELKAIVNILDTDGLHSHFVKHIINPQTLTFNKPTLVTTNKALDYYRKNVNDKKMYTENDIQNYIMDQKGNDFFLVQTAGRVYAESSTSAVVWMSEITITCTSPNGEEMYGRAIPYKNMRVALPSRMNYMDASKGQFLFPNFDEFNGTYVELIPGKENNYILLNDHPEKFDRPENFKSTGVDMTGIQRDDLTGCIFTFNSEGKMTKEYLFGKPTSAADAKYALFQTGDYNAETGMYVTQVVERVNGKKVISIAWMNLK